jgi:XTP/dITP diphosphohydrolase
MSDLIRLILATRNPHKSREFAQILGSAFALEDLRGHPEIGEIVEDGATFEENARLKAITVSRQLPGLVLSDDSGLEVDSLGGAPGVFSARYAGAGASDEANRQKLLAELAERGPDAARTARFHCALALARDGRVLAIYEGSVVGEIVRQACGAAGFGYDPLFQPNEFAETFAELPAATKNSISHRGRAVAKMKQFFRGANLLK